VAAGEGFLGGIGRALSHKAFFLLWWSNGFNTTGRWMFRTALGALTWQLTESPWWLGALAFADTIPMVLLSIVAGAWADRFGNLIVLRLSQALLVAVATIMSILALQDGLNLIYILFFAFWIGVADAITTPARLSLVNLVVPRPDLSAAIAVNSATFNFSRFLGPALFGLFVQFLSIPTIMAMGTGMFGVFYIALFFQESDSKPKEPGKKRRFFRELKEGFAYATAHKGIFYLLILLGVTALFMRPYIDLAPGISDQLFQAGEEGLSILLSSTGFGAMLAGLWLAHRGRTEGLTNIFTWSMLFSAFFMLLLVLSNHIWMGAALMICVGFTVVCGSITSQALVQNAVDPSVRGRVIAITIVLAWGMPALGAAGMGLIAEFHGLAITLAGGAVLTILCWGWAIANKAKATPLLEGDKD
jgi:MFS family permease